MNIYNIKSKLFVLILIFSCFCRQVSFAQGIVSVDQVKGQAQIVLPISSVSKGSLMMPVSLEYVSSGTKLTDDGIQYGVGWYLNAGGKIERVLNDLPDDQSNGGWLYGNNATLIESFNIANDNNATTCTDETSDINYINNNFQIGKDTEPDIFNISAPGLSCQLVFDKNHQPKIIPYNDYQVTYTTNSYGIETFLIIKDDGTQYSFSQPDRVKKKTSEPDTAIPYFKREYEQYKTEIAYNSSWYLTLLTDVHGNKINIEYINSDTRDNKSLVKVYEKNSSGSFVNKRLYSLNENIPSKLISSISGETSIRFIYNDNKSLKSIILPGERILNLKYKGITSVNALGNFTTWRYYLSAIGEEGCDALPQYEFFYNSVDLANSTSILPTLYANQKDAWGYFNNSLDTTTLIPKVYVYPDHPQEKLRLNPIPNYSGQSYILGGADRSANVNVVAAGSLSKIIYPTGGSTTLEYESNTFFDDIAQTTINGGGIRIKKLTHSDGLTSSNNMITEYSYNNPATGRSSGKILMMPALAFVKASSGNRYSQSYWESSIVRSEENLSYESTSVLYDYVTIKQTGAGKTVNEYNNPGGYWDQPTGYWGQVVNYVARLVCQSYGDLLNSKNSYPYGPNPNYGFKRGQLKSTTLFNESGLKVSKIDYSYIATNAPIVVTGLKLDENNITPVYTKYKILTQSGDLIASKKETLYDLNDDTKYSESINFYAYTSNNHKQLMKLSTTNSDGIIYQTYYKYVKDYVTYSAGDTANLALHGLKAANANSVIEIRKSIVKPDLGESFISGDLTKFSAVNVGYQTTKSFVPFEYLKFVSPDGSSTFQQSQISTSGSFLNDSRYISFTKFDNHDSYGRARSIQHRGQNIISRHMDDRFYDQPIISIENARYNEIAFSSFESYDHDEEFKFSLVGFSSIKDSRTGRDAIQGSGSSTMEKNLKKGKAKNYVFSVWLKGSSTGNLNISLTNTANLIKNYTLTFTGSSTWKYHEISVPVADMTSSFKIKIQPTVAVIIDDVLFYPENANIITNSYDNLGNKVSETGMNGQALYYEYDRIGRLRYIRDTDRNILKKESYQSYNTVQSLSTPSIKVDQSNLVDGIGIPFEIGTENSCLLGVTYNWDFGDGTTIINNTKPIHSFASPGMYQVKLTATHPTLGTKNYILPVNVLLRPLDVQICASGIVRVDNCRFESPLIASCPGISTPNNQTNVVVSSVTGCTGSLTYLWEQSSNNGSTWTAVGTTSTFNRVLNLLHKYNSYQLRVKVTSSCGRIGTSDVFEFVGYNSTPDCLPQ